MTDPTIICPNCKAEIKLTESLAAPLLNATRQEYDKQLQEQRASIAADEAKKARALLGADLEAKGNELADLREVLKQRDEKLAEAQKAQAELIRKQRELDDAKREMDLTVEKRVQESLVSVRDRAKQEAEEGLKLRVMEKEQTIVSMQKTIDDLKRKAEQGSQQLQGEVLEIQIESILRASFPNDGFEPVPKGEHGGDLLQTVSGPSNQPCGRILWESKRTKNWNDGWLAKLREDQRTAKAEIAIIVSEVRPKDCDTFTLLEGIWVSSPRCIVPVAIALRHSLIELHLARQAGDGQQTKMELVYQYLTGPRFRHRIEAIVEKFSDMHDDLDKERRTLTKLWARREEQIRCAVESTAGMYGDLQGIAGRSLQEIDGLELRQLAGDSADAEQQE